MNELNLDILSGGYFHCTEKWDRKYSDGHGCYKIYFPISGEGEVLLDSNRYNIKEGSVCFINGFKLKEQSCRNSMDVCWVHFVPQSLLMNSCLAKAPQFYSWSFDDIPFKREDFDYIPALFEDPLLEENKPSISASIDIKCRVSSILLYLISDLLFKCNIDIENDYLVYYKKLRSAIEYMDNNFSRDIDLKGIANCVNLDPSYFLRTFKRNFNMTPFEYITSKRMNKAWQMVTSSELSIFEISEQLGYCSQFHFSYVFKKHFGASPMKLRNYKKVP